MSRLDQRSSLDTLTKARLLELAAHLGVEVASSQTKAEVVDALAASKRASFEQILLTLRRDELKDICRGQRVSDKGREKQVLVDRILGREAASHSSARVKKAASSSTASTKPRRSTMLDENRLGPHPVVLAPDLEPLDLPHADPIEPQVPEFVEQPAPQRTTRASTPTARSRSFRRWTTSSHLSHPHPRGDVAGSCGWASAS